MASLPSARLTLKRPGLNYKRNSRLLRRAFNPYVFVVKAAPQVCCLAYCFDRVPSAGLSPALSDALAIRFKKAVELH
jgi:hypothetical protein